MGMYTVFSIPRLMQILRMYGEMNPMFWYDTGSVGCGRGDRQRKHYDVVAKSLNLERIHVAANCDCHSNINIGDWEIVVPIWKIKIIGRYSSIRMTALVWTCFRICLVLSLPSPWMRSQNICYFTIENNIGGISRFPLFSVTSCR